ncbi:MAG: hypothetical protein HFG30_07930 [Eubacterium sp.]|jgi:anionic cell wall polymer biosynthesis LytR-Cps2A-Psr (LCP) family protein|nr:hypothetical protein [Eubacterium sp.]
MQDKKKFYEAKWFLWLFLILFPPIGIILLWVVHKDMKKNKKIILTVIFAIWFIIMAATSGNNSSTNSSANKQQETNMTKENEVSTAKETEAKKDTKTELKEQIEKVVGSDMLETFNYVPENNFSLIKFKGSENLSNKMTVKGMYLDIFNILKEIQSTIDTDVDFNVTYPLKDKYGNVSDDIVIKATFKNDTIKKINFENALFEKIPDMADEWWNHNALNFD